MRVFLNSRRLHPLSSLTRGIRALSYRTGKQAHDHMTSIRSMLARVQRLESKGTTDRPSSIEAGFGSLAAFEEHVNAKIAEGRLDQIEMPLVIVAIRRWHADGVWRNQGRASVRR